MIDQALQLLYSTLAGYPTAYANIIGNSEIHNLQGQVLFYPFLRGTLVVAAVDGIPFEGFYGFHIHEHGPCTPGEGYVGFFDVGLHYNPTEQPHPFHAGDLPVLIANFAYAFMIVYTDRFVPEEVIGRTVIIHSWPDDYLNQPVGNSGDPIGCGDILPYIPPSQ